MEVNLINIGDDVTISGKIINIKNGCICIETKLGTKVWIDSGDIKTHRPIKEN